MEIDTNSWHYRWYAYWLTHGRGVKPGYQENLCHYVRVLVFWAPITWLDRLTNVGTWGPRAFAVAYLSALLLVFVGVAIVLPAMTQTTKFLMAIGSLAGLIAMLGMLYGTGKFVTTHRIPKPPTLGLPTTTRLIFAYGKAKKRRICPFITFSGQPEAEADAHTS